MRFLKGKVIVGTPHELNARIIKAEFVLAERMKSIETRMKKNENDITKLYVKLDRLMDLFLKDKA